MARLAITTMALDLTSPTFGPVVFAKNPVIFRLRSTPGFGGGLYAAKGPKSKVQAGVGERFANGETLTVDYEEPDGTTETIVFTASATYEAENELPDDTYGGSLTQYWEICREKVEGHHRISPYFTVTRTGPLGGSSLTIHTRSSAAGWEVAFSNSAGFAIIATAATDDTTPVNYSVLLEVFFEASYKGGDYSLVAQLKNSPDAQGYLYFDISSILAAQCRAGLTEPVVPEWATSDTALADNLRRWYVRYTEEYGAPVEAQEWEYDQVRVCMNGGVSQSVFAGGDFLAGLSATDSLLTWMPDGRKIGLSQPEFLAWYNWDTVDRYVLIEMKWIDIEDGTVSTPTQHFSELRVRPQEVGLLPVNPTLLGLDSEANAYKYQVRVVYLDGTYIGVSQWRTYFIDRDYYRSERYLQYLNGFGVVECWRCTGVWGKKMSVERQVAESSLLPGYNEFATNRFQFGAIWDQELTYRTGFITRGQADVLQEMLIAGEVYDVSEDGYIPLRITANSFQVTDTDEDLHAYQFTAQPRLDMRNYSKIRLTTSMSGAWLEPGGDAWFDAALVPWELP